MVTYQQLFNKILGFGKEFFREFIFQLYNLLKYKILISTTQKRKRVKMSVCLHNGSAQKVFDETEHIRNCRKFS